MNSALRQRPWRVRVMQATKETTAVPARRVQPVFSKALLVAVRAPNAMQTRTRRVPPSSALTVTQTPPRQLAVSPWTTAYVTPALSVRGGCVCSVWRENTRRQRDLAAAATVRAANTRLSWVLRKAGLV